MNFIAEILTFFMRPLYQITQNYGLTIIIFTIFIKLLTLPLTVKSQKSNAKIQQIQPLIQEVNNKYKNDNQKANEEISKIYTKYEINPLGGCLPLLVQLFVLFGFIRVIYSPLTYLLGLTASEINVLAEKIGFNMANSQQIALCGQAGLNEALIEMGKVPLNFNFFGIDLSLMPQMSKIDVLWIIPVLAVIATVISNFVTQKQMSKQGQNAEQTASMNKSMMIFMPIMTAWFAFKMPVAASLYWFISTFTQIAQQLVMPMIVKPLDPIEVKKKKVKKVQE